LSHGADLDDDGDITNGLRPDGGVTIDDPTVFLELYEDGHAGADVDDGSGLGLKDGGVTVDDLVLYLAWFEGGVVGSVADNRFLYRGYWWDPVLEMYHVRHRVYDPKSHRFLQPDPMGVAAGRNVYTYCEGDPVNCYDPYGLFSVMRWIYTGDGNASDAV
jgi:RHS repeat-associated protein